MQNELPDLVNIADRESVLPLESHRHLLRVILQVEREPERRFVVLDVDVENEVVLGPIVKRLGTSRLFRSLVDHLPELDPARLGPLRSRAS